MLLLFPSVSSHTIILAPPKELIPPLKYCLINRMNHLLDDATNEDSPNANELIQDFVVVSLQESLCSAEDDIDDNSYDYCEDACSLLSSDEHGQDLLYDSLEMTDSSLHLKDSILTVPSVLMKDLDDAHAAASLTRITDLAVDNSSGSSLPSSLGSSEESKFPDEHHCDNVASFSSPPTDAVVKNEFLFSAIGGNVESPTPTYPTSEVVDCEKTIDSSTRRCESLESLSHDQEAGTGVEEEETVVRSEVVVSIAPLPLVTTRTHQNAVNSSSVDSLNISRTSNKKRRKKLKLLKKAQAAASAAHKLSERSLETMKMTKAHAGGTYPPLQALRMRASPSRGSSKKIANIAVVCAKETMSAYREELMRTCKTTAGG